MNKIYFPLFMLFLDPGAGMGEKIRIQDEHPSPATPQTAHAYSYVPSSRRCWCCCKRSGVLLHRFADRGCGGEGGGREVSNRRDISAPAVPLGLGGVSINLTVGRGIIL
jgi:hypothetical protein